MQHANYAKSFLQVTQIAKLVDLASESAYTADVLVDDASKLLKIALPPISNSLSLLIDSGVARIDSEGFVNVAHTSEQSIRKHLISRLGVDKVLLSIANAMELKNEDGSRDIDIYILFPKLRGIPALCTSLGLLERDSDRNKFFVSAEKLSHFEPLLEEGNLSRYEKGMTPEQLHQQQLAQNERGELAEEFVLAQERTRLNGHPNIEAVKRVSKFNVSAGFDIQSFESLHSKHIDRLIEVKSFVGEPGFYWSINEIKCSSSKGAQYSIVVVDSTRMEEPEYSPSEIRNPFEILRMAPLLGDHTEGPFEISPTNFYISLKGQ